MRKPKRRVVLVQLPIPPAGHAPIRGNIPLAAGYLKLLARKRGLEAAYEIVILPAWQANSLGDEGLAAAILECDPWLVGFTCYLWNVERTLWIAERLKHQSPGLLVLLGGPEASADNRWVLEHPAVDYAAIGEGEQTFVELLSALEEPRPPARIDGLYTAAEPARVPAFRAPLGRLDEISSPYLEGILNAADEQMLLLETIRGCTFRCKFCYYPKSYDALYFLSEEKIRANLEHARQCQAREVVLLDPTLNQRQDFAGFLRLLARENAERQFTCFGELRAEGITPETARLLREANFTEVEVGLQSIDPRAQELMDRKNHLRAFERGARAMLDEGIEVKVDLIIGLPGDTRDSIRRGLEYLHNSRLYSLVQVFNLAILPGTAFRQEAQQLGLAFQARPPYYVLSTPTLAVEDLYGLMEEAQDLFQIEYDPPPPPMLNFRDSAGLRRCSRIDLDVAEHAGIHWGECGLPAATARAQAFTLWLRAGDFDARRAEAARFVERVLADNPFTTLELVLEPTGETRALTARSLDLLARACYARPSYLDRFYSMQPGSAKGAKRLVVLAPTQARLPADWIEEIESYADLVWPSDQAADDLQPAPVLE